MGGIAQLAKEAGHQVSGSDANSYPPMSKLLKKCGIEISSYDQLWPGGRPDQVVIGNVLSRGHPAVERVLDEGVAYCSGPEWLSRELLNDRWVLAVAGTHGKTTVSSMLTWILEVAGHNPSFLIGGIAENLGVSARLTQSPFFVVEADEYDTAFFDKRSKFVHYRPLTLVLHNLEYDHADIFDDLAQIQRQFHHLVRTVPRAGQIFVNQHSQPLSEVLQMGCWSQQINYGFGDKGEWGAWPVTHEGSRFLVGHRGDETVEIQWDLCGRHNVINALAAVAAASAVGVEIRQSVSALEIFSGVRRRLQLLASPGGIRIYDDFAHHPTAIRTTLEGLRAREGKSSRIFAVIEPRSNTMKLGIHNNLLNSCTEAANHTVWMLPDELMKDFGPVLNGPEVTLCPDVKSVLHFLHAELRSGDHAVIMSCGDFDGLARRLIDQLQEQHRA